MVFLSHRYVETECYVVNKPSTCQQGNFQSFLLLCQGNIRYDLVCNSIVYLTNICITIYVHPLTVNNYTLATKLLPYLKRFLIIHRFKFRLFTFQRDLTEILYVFNWKLDCAAPLVTDPPHAISTTRQNKPIYNPYVAVTFEPIKQDGCWEFNLQYIEQNLFIHFLII